MDSRIPLFFLNKEETDGLFNFFELIQNPGDFIGSVSFQETLKEPVAFQRLLGFLNQKVSNTKRSDYQTIPDEYYRTKVAYQLMDHQDYSSLSKKYGNIIRQNQELILNENFYLLKKTHIKKWIK